MEGWRERKREGGPGGRGRKEERPIGRESDRKKDTEKERRKKAEGGEL